MGFVQAVKTCCSKFFTATGRASRSEFWWYYLFIVIISGVLGVIGGFSQNYGTEQTWIGVILEVFSFILGISLLCAEIRRFHDTGKSGWNIWWGIIPLVGWIIIIVKLCKPSEPGENKYGPEPE